MHTHWVRLAISVAGGLGLAMFVVLGKVVPLPAAALLAPTPLPTMTAVPTRTPTPPVVKAAATLTRTPLPVATTAAPVAPPVLLSPQDKALFRGSRANIVLKWRAGQPLASDQQYRLSLRYRAKNDVPREINVVLRESSWPVPTSLYNDAASTRRSFEWDVTIVNKVVQEGQEGWAAAGPTSPAWTFTWR